MTPQAPRPQALPHGGILGVNLHSLRTITVRACIKLLSNVVKDVGGGGSQLQHEWEMDVSLLEKSLDLPTNPALDGILIG